MHQALRLRVGQRLNQSSLGRSEDRSGRAQSEADRQNDGRRENGRTPHATQRDTEILQQRIHYSFLNAIIGSIRAARRAGKYAANAATAPSTSAAMRYASGCVG